MSIVPIDLATANTFVEKHHRHNRSVVGHKFSIGLEREGKLIGVAIAGRPIARMLDDGATLEIRRVCVMPGSRNACSMLLARARNIGRLMGYRRIITYTLQKESGASLRAVNARRVAEVRPGNWKRKGHARLQQPVFRERKHRWELQDEEGPPA